MIYSGWSVKDLMAMAGMIDELPSSMLDVKKTSSSFL